MKYVIIRTYSAGIFRGQMAGVFGDKQTGQGVTVRNTRRIWYWDMGEVDTIEILDMSPAAKESIKNVPISISVATSVSTSVSTSVPV